MTSRTAACRDVFRLAAAAAENGQPLAIAPAAQDFVSSVRGALRERGTLLESLQECPPQESKIDIDPQFLSQVGPEGGRVSSGAWKGVLKLDCLKFGDSARLVTSQRRGSIWARLGFFAFCELKAVDDTP